MRGRPPPQTAGWLSRAVLPALPHTTHQDGALWGTSLCGTRLHAPAAGRNEGGRAGGYSHLDGTGQAWWRRCSCERGGGGGSCVQEGSGRRGATSREAGVGCIAPGRRHQRVTIPSSVFEPKALVGIY